LSLLITEPLIA